jgi:NADH-quinone oxidoreductase subunit G
LVLAKLLAALGSSVPSEINALWKVIAAEIPVLGTMTFANLPETGLLLDATPWSGLPFVEGETLHYKPAKAAVGNL